MTLIVDTTILSNFSFARRPDLLRADSLERIVTTTQVMDEYQDGVEKHLVPLSDWHWLSILTLDTPEEIRLFNQLHQRLGAGESSCLSLAMYREFMVLTDDSDARRWAHRSEIPVSGTIGLLVQLVQGKAITLKEANGLLTVMREHGYYAPIASLDELIS
ncbi:MAG: hypothetical protein ETSY1_03530 [Candidatus Entotheonella factor]|uniref:PIN domain-containing protein n=1 Tax=Entotheonella factor TaxID=1429438 RepID=W4LWG8_ENTF1|nr:hypothetical protein [Candidatus Entotheonella palauensis]ETX02454.1 MAG: hypothetical protein ETSY1_03530 [Candidatus Entotheonella factor]